MNISLQILLTMIWLRRYPTMQMIAEKFGMPVSCVHKIIHKFIRILHVHLVPKYICWHSMNQWRRLAGVYPEWPRVVAILDCTPFRISRPKGLSKSLSWSWFVFNNLKWYVYRYTFCLLCHFRCISKTFLSCW